MAKKDPNGVENKQFNNFMQALDKFWEDCKEENSRYKSWEHCYEEFYKARGKKLNDTQKDHLCLHLAFYLASWGMLRGSFLLQRDFKIHTKAVEEILKKDYDCLRGASCSEVNKNWDKLETLSANLKKIYGDIRAGVPGKKNIAKDVSDILITKILMGTLGCVPAYDRFFVAAVRKDKKQNSNKGISGCFGKNSVGQLDDFYDKHNTELEEKRKGMKTHGLKLKYPEMKLLDMGFWQLGFKAARKKTK